MNLYLLILLAAGVLAPAAAAADAPKDDPKWLTSLRNSGTYREGLARANEKIDLAYDVGAVRGASHWETIHDYYVEVAKAKGCETGFPYAHGPVRTCHEISTAKPEFAGRDYDIGKKEIATLAREATYPELVKAVLMVIYDYGYVQGMNHGLRTHNDDLVWAQTYYKACMERVNDAKHEPTCANASKSWAEEVLLRMRKRVEAHGLPPAAKPK